MWSGSRPPGAWSTRKRETAAEIAALDARLRSRREVVASHGRDIETLDEELNEDAQAA
jgi:hypothetical protein